MTRQSTKPYLLRALLEWCHDNEYTPYIVVWVNEMTQVPMQFVKDNEIILNISATAANQLTIDNEWIHFSARFSGIPHDIWVPVGHVKSIFARETGEGMGFDVEPLESNNETESLDHLSLVENKETDSVSSISDKNTDSKLEKEPLEKKEHVVKKGLKIIK